MSRIRSKGNASTELRMLDLLEKNQINGWQMHQNLFGNPDFVFIEKK